MTVSKIVKSKQRGLFDIYIDEELSFSALREVMLRFDIYEGAEIDSSAMRKAKALQKELFAKQSALDILSRRDYSKSAFSQKLRKKGFSGETVEKTADLLEEKGFLNDESYAERLCEYLFNVKKYGAIRVKSELFEKGIRGELAERCIEELEGDSQERLLCIIKARYKKDELSDITFAKKAASKLMRLGYSYSQIRTAIKDFCNIEIEEE